MRVQSIYCDKCEKQIPENLYRFYCDAVDAKTGDFAEEIPFAELRGLDFCEKCATEAAKAIMPVPVVKIQAKVKAQIIKPEIPEDTEERKRKKVDWGKACALKNAGWQVKDIAEELSISPAVISQGFYRMNKKGEKHG